MDSRIPKAKAFAPIPPEVERVGKIVLDAAFRVHTALGPGLLESVYMTCHAYEIRESGLLVESQVAVPVAYKNMRMEGGLRLDLLVEKSVIVEVKAVEMMNPVYEAQLLTYLRLTGIRLGYLINYTVPHLKNGIKRMVV
ncbi:MAG: GxxExxY protein [Chloroflexi bacterium]|nr:GxxExxY protein [Chloroflexota bacterium]